MKLKPIRIYCDGAGMRPDGKGSGFAWLRKDTREKHVERADGLTNNQAEYHAVLSALESVPSGSAVQIVTDSELVTFQVSGAYKADDPKMAELLNKVQRVIERKRLGVSVIWKPRTQNLAGKLL